MIQNLINGDFPILEGNPRPLIVFHHQFLIDAKSNGSGKADIGSNGKKKGKNQVSNQASNEASNQTSSQTSGQTSAVAHSNKMNSIDESTSVSDDDEEFARNMACVQKGISIFSTSSVLHCLLLRTSSCPIPHSSGFDSDRNISVSFKIIKK